MRILVVAILGLFVTTAFCQEKGDDSLFAMAKADDVWVRFTTFERGYAEVNTNVVMWGRSGPDEVGRLLFRQVNLSPIPLEGTKFNYKTQEFAVELNCTADQWRTYQVEYIDKNDKVILRQEPNPDAKWRTGGSGGRYLAAGCKIIAKNRGAAPTNKKTADQPPDIVGPAREKP